MHTKKKNTLRCALKIQVPDKYPSSYRGQFLIFITETEHAQLHVRQISTQGIFSPTGKSNNLHEH